jgi:hypothetical protein
LATASRSRLIPSTGVLLAAVGAAVVAAILTNVYLSAAKEEVTEGSIRVLQMTRGVELGDVITRQHIRVVEVPGGELFDEAFRNAIRPELMDALVVNHSAPNQLYAHQILFYTDMNPKEGVDAPVDVKEGYEIRSIRISDVSAGKQLQPGAYVSVEASFDVTPPDGREKLYETVEVIEAVPIRLIDGEAKPNVKGAKNTIGLVLSRADSLAMAEVEAYMESKGFRVQPTSRPRGYGQGEVKVTDAARRVVERVKAMREAANRP